MFLGKEMKAGRSGASNAKAALPSTTLGSSQRLPNSLIES